MLTFISSESEKVRAATLTFSLMLTFLLYALLLYVKFFKKSTHLFFVSQLSLITVDNYILSLMIYYYLNRGDNNDN